MNCLPFDWNDFLRTPVGLSGIVLILILLIFFLKWFFKKEPTDEES